MYNYPLPPQTEVVEQNATVTLLGNGNHCDFVATQSLTSKLDRAALETYYQDVTIPRIDKEPLYSEYDQKEFVSIILEFDETNSSDEVIHFTITAIDAGYPAGLDFRCR